MRPVCCLNRTKNLRQSDGLHFISDSLKNVSSIRRSFWISTRYSAGMSFLMMLTDSIPSSYSTIIVCIGANIVKAGISRCSSFNDKRSTARSHSPHAVLPWIVWLMESVSPFSVDFRRRAGKKTRQDDCVEFIRASLKSLWRSWPLFIQYHVYACQ